MPLPTRKIGTTEVTALGYGAMGAVSLHELITPYCATLIPFPSHRYFCVLRQHRERRGAFQGQSHFDMVVHARLKTTRGLTGAGRGIRARVHILGYGRHVQ